MNKYVAIGLMLVLTVMVTGSALSLWSDKLRLNVTVKTGEHDPVIGSYKVFKCAGCCHSCGVEDNEAVMYSNRLELNLTLEECRHEDSYDSNHSSTDDHHNITIWVGLVLENVGMVPSTLTSIRVTSMPDNMSISGIYVYGSYNDGSFSREVWAHETCSTLPPSDPGTLGVGFTPGEKLVVWIKFIFSGDCSRETLEFTIMPMFQPGFPRS